MSRRTEWAGPIEKRGVWHSFFIFPSPSALFKALEPPDSTPGTKRKLQVVTPLKGEASNKRMKTPAYFLRDVAQVVAMCDHIFPLAHIGFEVTKFAFTNLDTDALFTQSVTLKHICLTLKNLNS